MRDKTLGVGEVTPPPTPQEVREQGAGRASLTGLASLLCTVELGKKHFPCGPLFGVLGCVGKRAEAGEGPGPSETTLFLLHAGF